MRYKTGALAIVIVSVLVAVGCAAGAKNSTAPDEKPRVELIVSSPPLFYSSTGAAGELVADTHFLVYAAEKFISQYEEMDVSIRVNTFDYVQEPEAIAGKFDTPEATDVLFEGFFNMGNYIQTGRMLPLDDIVDGDLRADVPGVIWERGMSDGKTYMYPFYQLPNTMAYNAELFRQAGLGQYIAPRSDIANWSLKEWERILDTLSERLPASVFPMMMYGKNNQGDVQIMTLLRMFGCPFFDGDDRFHLSTPEGVLALKWIQDGVDRGWFPPKSENLEFADLSQLFANGQLAIHSANPTNLVYYQKNQDIRLVNFPSADGKGLSAIFIMGFGVFDNGDENKARAAKDFVKFVCEDQELSQASLPNIPIRASEKARLGDQIDMFHAYEANEAAPVDFTRKLPNWAKVRETFYPEIAALLAGEKTPEESARDIDAKCNEAVYNN